MDSLHASAKAMDRPRQRAWHFSRALVIGGSLIVGCTSTAKDPAGPDPGPPAIVAAASATSQTGGAGQPVGSRPSVLVTDADGISVPGVQVVFNLTAGGGSFAGGTQTTNGSGIAIVGSWTLGAVAGSNTMTATVSGLAGSPVTFNATGGAVSSNFDILVTYLTGTPTGAALAAFQAAEQKWERVIIGDVPDWNFGAGPGSGIPAGTCDPQQPARTTGILDDVEIMVVLDSIDGPFGILGQAGPCASRPAGSNSYTILGVMIFDTADVARLQVQGKLNATILHEMGHVLGFGTHWEGAPFNLLTGAGTGNPRFTGQNAVAAFTTLNNGTGTTVPVDNSGVPGTADAHWREGPAPSFGSELMTGTLSGTSQPMSATTIRSMQDLAYQVNVGEADPFDYTNPGSLRQNLAAPPERLVNDILRRPRYTFGPNGLMAIPMQR